MYPHLVASSVPLVVVDINNVTYFQVDRLEDELVGEQEKFKAITEELEQTFAEMSGY